MAELTPSNAPRQPDDLAGALVARPGLACPASLQSTRREWAPVLARGRPASALPGLLSAVYALCGGAHRWTSAAAVAAARGAAAPPTAADRGALQADTLREHLRRIWLDWPRVLPLLSGDAPDPAALATCPLLLAPRGEQGQQDQQDLRAVHAAARAWVEQALLGRPAAAWWTGWCQGGIGFVRDWAWTEQTVAAVWLRAADAALGDAAVPCRPLSAVADGMAEAAMRGLAARLRTEPAFALHPDWQGLPCETGPWARWADGGPTGALPVFHRLAARLAEVAALLLDDGDQRLAQGGLALGAGEGIAWCEMARGLLVHWVQLRPGLGADGTPVVECCRVIAPTEWNFHAGGALAQALAQSPADLPDTTLRLMAAAFDPCVALSIERPATPHAQPAHPANEDPRCTR